MLERDLITRNIQVLVQILTRAKGLMLDKPEEALAELEKNMDESILEKLEKKSGPLMVLDDQLVKVQVDLAYLRAQILHQLQHPKSQTELLRVKQLMLNYQEVFPKNFPFDYYSKLSWIDSVVG
ncbi:MAG: hypothetical protein DI598_06175 [Pseudopedobacter saltans]|uniref:Uncharacterized protein n=1 Tax=Pseudopedobacter saltans TaxID=151895 RepID=A0A2W5F459_9SPHI|nr:MAG: hypothetical protein DI598_06175 [Pseudopedobacter saltans]